MHKLISQLEITINGKTCRFVCENDTDTGIVKEALFQFTKYIGQLEDTVKARMEQEAQEKAAQNEATDGSQQVT